MRYAISWEGHDALIKLRDDLRRNNTNISDACTKLHSVVGSHGSSIGIYEDPLNDLISEVNRAQAKGEAEIDYLSGKIEELASNMEDILNEGL